MEEISLEFHGPLPQPQVDETRIPLLDKHPPQKKDPLDMNEKSKALVMASGKKLNCTKCPKQLRACSIPRNFRNMFSHDVLKMDEACVRLVTTAATYWTNLNNSA